MEGDFLELARSRGEGDSSPQRNEMTLGLSFLLSFLNSLNLNFSLRNFVR